jgi:hypothetical protein
MGDISPEAKKLLDARKAAIEELKQIDGKNRAITDHDVMRLANCRLMVDALTLRMIAGDVVSPSEVKQAHEMVDLALEDAGMRSKCVEVKFVQGCIGIYDCQHCGKRNELTEGNYQPTGRVSNSPNSIDLLPEPLHSDGRAEVLVIGDKAVAATPVAPISETKPTATPSPAIAKPERPYHETALKDSRPNAPANANGGGSAVWFGTANGSKYPLDWTR